MNVCVGGRLKAAGGRLTDVVAVVARCAACRGVALMEDFRTRDSLPRPTPGRTPSGPRVFAPPGRCRDVPKLGPIPGSPATDAHSLLPPGLPVHHRASLNATALPLIGGRELAELGEVLLAEAVRLGDEQGGPAVAVPAGDVVDPAAEPLAQGHVAPACPEPWVPSVGLARRVWHVQRPVTSARAPKFRGGLTTRSPARRA